jgi:hypothetical protein
LQSSDKRTWIWLGVMLLLFIVAGYFLSSGQPEEYPGYVSESPSPTGTKAFYTYLEENVEVDRWEHDPELLPGEDRDALLFMIEPFFVPDQMQMNEYIRYMQAGNTILLFKNNPEAMFELAAGPGRAVTEETITLRDRQGGEYEALVPSQMRIEEKNTDEVLLQDDAGVIALKRPFGDGSLIVVNSPAWLANDSITDENHVELISFLMQQAEYDHILVDEHIHGAGSGPSTAALYPQWMLVIALQLAVLTLLWLMFKGKRFGPVRTPREAEVRFSNEQTTALAAWYQRGRRYQDSLKLQADYVKLLLQEKWGIPYRRTWQESAELLKRKVNEMPAEEVGMFTLELTKLLNKESVNKQEYLAWSEKLDRLQREVEEE